MTLVSTARPSEATPGGDARGGLLAIPPARPAFRPRVHGCGYSGRVTAPTEPRPSRERTVSTQIWTLPNVLSFLRVLGVPLFLWLLLRGDDGWALVVLALSGVTDYLDGKIARTFGMESRLGQLLDPIADRLYICLLYTSDAADE